MIHGWPLLTAALTAGSLLWGSVCHHVERGASRFTPSTLYAPWIFPAASWTWDPWPYRVPVALLRVGFHAALALVIQIGAFLLPFDRHASAPQPNSHRGIE